MLWLPSTLLHYRDLLTASNHWGLEAQKNEICTRLRWWLFEKAAAEIAAQVLTDNIGLLCYAVFLSKSCEHWCCIFVHSAFPLNVHYAILRYPFYWISKKAHLLFQQDGAFFLQNRPKWRNVVTRTRLVHSIIMNEPCVTGHCDIIDTSIENVTMFTATWEKTK